MIEQIDKRKDAYFKLTIHDVNNILDFRCF